MNADVLARADVSKLLPKYKSEGEEWWAQYGALLLGDKLGCPVVFTDYHPLTLNAPGFKYTWDFQHLLADGRYVNIEVKALITKTEYVDHADGTTTLKRTNNSRVQKGYRDARTHLRAAAARRPFELWYEARVDGKGDYELELIEG